MHSSRLDQSAYISYLVDEALKESENRTPVVSPSSEANSQGSAPFPVALNFQLNSVPFSIPLVTNSSLQPVHSQSLHQPQQPVGYWVPNNSDVTVNQGLVPGLQQYSTRSVNPTCVSTNCSLPLERTQTYSSVLRYQPDSFRLSQHIGLSEQPVVNVSQINNKIQVQFQFGDDDRFIVQSRKPDSSTVGLNCQSLDNSCTDTSPDSGVHSQQLLSGVQSQQLLSGVQSQQLLSGVQSRQLLSGVQSQQLLSGQSSNTFPGDYRQFLVKNILGKSSNCDSAPSSTSEFRNHNGADHAYNSEYLLQNERNSVTVLDLSERWRNEVHRCRTKNSRCRNKVIKPRCSIKTTETVKEFLADKRRVPTATETKIQEIIVSELGLVANQGIQTAVAVELTPGLHTTIEDVIQDNHTESKQHFDLEFVKKDLHIESVKQDLQTESVQQDFHAESRAYFKEFLELAERQKAEKQKVSVNRHGNKRLSSNNVQGFRKKQLPTVIKSQVNYKCGICSEHFASTEEFEHHMTVNHSVENVIQDIHTESTQHFDTEFVKQDSQTESVKQDSHAESRAYYKEFLELEEKQKAEKQKVSVNRRVNKRSSRKKQLPTVIKSQVDYECEICSEPFASTKEFEHHMIVDHYDENIEHSTVDNLTVSDIAKKMEESNDIQECEGNVSNNQTVQENDIEDDTGSFLCTYCGHDCKTKMELDVHHQEVHKDEVEDDPGRQVQHVEEREYLQQSRQLLEEQKQKTIVQQREQEERQAAEQAETKLVEKISKTKNGKRPGPHSSKRKHQEVSDKVIESLPKRQAATQAKNNLMNPSKGKQKRVRNTANLDKEDEMLMKMFGIIPSKVCLSRVHEIETERNKSEDKTDGKTKSDENNSRNDCFKNSGDSKVTCVGNDDQIVKSEDALFSDDDSDIEIIEKPVELIILDEEDSPEKNEESLRKIDADVPLKENPISKTGCKSDAELMAQFGIKDISVKLTNSPVKSKVKCKMDPKSKTQKLSKDPNVCLPSSVTVPTKNINEMTPEEIDEMLKYCGMAISIPVHSSDVKEKSSSPKPSTSKGYGHLKRKKTARKSTQDSALIKKYKLKDSKVILKSLSKIEISMLRNPNSSFGKTNWLKHKFDSDTESDFEFDIPTPPETEDFIDDIAQNSNLSKQGTVKSSDHISESRTGRISAVKRQDLKLMEKFGLSEARVAINSPKKETSSGKNGKGKISDEELLKKFGIPSTMVVIHSSSEIQSSSNLAKPNVSSHEYIKISDFKIALDTATKSILCKLKDDPDTNKSSKVICNEPSSRANVRRKLDVNESKSQPSAKKMKTVAKYMQQKKMKYTKNLNDKRKISSDTGKENVQNCVSVANEEILVSANHKLLRPKLAKERTRQCKPRQSKANVALNSFKAKAVTRAIENRIKQTRHRQNEKQLELCQKNISGRKSMAEISKSKHERLSGESIKQRSQVVKTARYRRSDAQKKGKLKSELKELTKGLPELKVNVEYLTKNEIMKLKKSINSDELVDSADANMTSEKLVRCILDNSTDQVCGHSASTSLLVSSEESFSSVNSVAENLNEDDIYKLNKAKKINMDNIQNGELVQSDAAGIELNETEPELNNIVMNSSEKQSRGCPRTKKEEQEDEKINDNDETKMLNSKEVSDDKNVTDDQESDISLISIISESNEESNDKANMSKVNIQAIEEILNNQSENVDEVPLPKSKFYGEEKENIHDEVDDDTGAESKEDDTASEEKISTDQRNEYLENDTNEGVATDSCNESQHKTGTEKVVIDKKNEKLTDSDENDDTECNVTLKEKGMSDNIHRTEHMFSCFREVSDHKDNYELNKDDVIDSKSIERQSNKVLKRSASIIDKDSGDILGEYYDVDGSLKDLTRPYNNDQFKNIEKVGENNIVPIRSRSTTPDDVIETLSEN